VFFGTCIAILLDMAEDHVVLDAFAEARRSWDELISLQPDILAGSGHLETGTIAELTRRVEAHQAAIDSLVDALETQRPASSTITSTMGISNRVPAEQEAAERKAHPPIDGASPPPEDAAGRVGDEPLVETPNRHTSHKAGSRSIAQKEAGSRYPDRSTPSSQKVDGAFGREPKGADAG
jgi:hypothetical protein